MKEAFTEPMVEVIEVECDVIASSCTTQVLCDTELPG